MSGATNNLSGNLVTYAVKVNGSTISDETRILSVEVESTVSKIPTARMTILDGDPNTGTFNASSASTFVPGNEITIEAGYDAHKELIFKGIITRQSIEVSPAAGPSMIVECQDPAVKMTVGRKSLTFSNQKDSDLISSIVSSYSGLSVDVAATHTLWPEQVQYYATDWDFILSRAEVNGMIVIVENGKVKVAKPDSDTSSLLTIEYGNNLLEIQADLDAISQLGEVKAATWDFKTQSVVASEASNDHPGPGNLSSKELSEVVGLSEFQLQTSASLGQAELTDWAKAQLVKSEYAKIQGKVKFQGTNRPTLGKYITLKGLGDRFNGDHLVSGIYHSLSEGNWTTEVNFGLSPTWFTQEPDVMAPPASGLLPAARGLFNGTVKKAYEDPDNQYRILVNIPLFETSGEGIWARLSNFYSTNGAGAFFLPEVGDEVIIGFLNEDPRYPVILGSVYSSTALKPSEGLEPNEKNSLKALVSKSGMSVQFDDENKVLSITTPAGNKAVFSDRDKQISVQDENGNSIIMSDDGITLKSPKNITFEADQNLVLKGTQGVSIESSPGDVVIRGTNIKETAEVEYSAEGSSTAKIQGGAELTLKGAMVMIN